MRALRAGAHGYVLKSADESELLEGIIKVSQGHVVLGRGVAEKVVSGLLGGKSESEGKLTDIERRTLLYVAAGYENDQIGRVMGTSMMQVIESLATAMDKLGAKDRHAAALKALNEGYIVIEELHTLNP
jgi:DNA-binding NarL/FixJ family response regulator